MLPVQPYERQYRCGHRPSTGAQAHKEKEQNGAATAESFEEKMKQNKRAETEGSGEKEGGPE